MTFKGHGSPHRRGFQLEELSGIPHARIRREGFQALQRQDQTAPERPRKGGQCVLQAQARCSLNSRLIGNIIDPALNGTQTRWRKAIIHQNNTEVTLKSAW